MQNFRAKPEHQAGDGAGTGSRRPAVEHRRGAADPAGRCARAGAAEPVAGRVSEADRRRHRRLGRRVAGDAGPREPRGAVAADRGAGTAHRRDGQGAGAATAGVSGLCVRRGPLVRARHRHARAPRDRRRGLGARGRLGARPHRAAEAAGRDAAPDRSHGRQGGGEGGVGRKAGRGRDRAVVRGARRRLRPCHHRRRRAASVGQRRDRALRGQPQHQLHQHLLLPLPVLRVLQGQDARGAARHAVRPGAGRGGAALARGVGPRCDRGVPARRHPPRLHRRDLSRHLPRDQGRRCPTCTSTRSRRWR